MRRKVGSVVRIQLNEREFAFAQVLKEPLCAFFHYKSENPAPSIETIIASPIAFCIWVRNKPITSGEWPVLGVAAVSPSIDQHPAFFKKDVVSGKLFITHDGAGDEEPVTADRIAGLECAAVWESAQVVERLRDHFAGRPNYWVELYKK